MNNTSNELNSPARRYELFADILAYPASAIYDRSREYVSALATTDDTVCTELKKFFRTAEEISLSRLEEIYSRTFDLQAVCVPYAGCHLFGEDPARGMFMVKLGALYRSRNVKWDGELPDHISVMLRFLSVSDGGEERQELIDYCLIPSVRKMVKCFRENDNPYQGILKAVLLALEEEGRDAQCTDESPMENDRHG